jgi:4-amino-4-deoxy-L-arabinose transferase-like glycosyltransferase
MRQLAGAMPDMTATVRRMDIDRVARVVLIAMLVLAAVLALYHLESYPASWFDEGWWLQIPKNLALHGQYASYSSEGFRYSDTIVSASPAFFLPVAASFKLFGVGLLQARIVIATFFVMTAGLIYALGVRAFGRLAGLVAVALYVFVKPDDEFTSALFLGRMFMAEIPAMFFLLLGMCLWIDVLERERLCGRRLVAVGVLFGLAIAIKAQLMMATLPLIVCLGVADRLVWHRYGLKAFLIPFLATLIVIALHVGGIYLFLGPQWFGQFAADFTASAGNMTTLLFSQRARMNALGLFQRSEYALLVVAAAVYQVFAMRQSKRQRFAPILVWTFVVFWLGWFLIASVGWSRYAFPGLALGHLLVARLLVDLAGVDDRSVETISVSRARRPNPSVRLAAAAIIFIVIIAGTSRTIIHGIVTPPDRFAEDMAAFIDAHVQAGERIETWEWEIAFLSRMADFHHPPTKVLAELVGEKQLGTRSPVYDIGAYGTSYLLIGPFADWTAFYTSFNVQRRGTLVHKEGPYTLYRIGPNS